MQIHVIYKQSQFYLREIHDLSWTRKNSIVYYEKFKIDNLIKKNSNTCAKSTLQRINIIYALTCTLRNCVHDQSKLINIYIGQTPTCVSRRIMLLLSDHNSIKNPLNIHGNLPTSINNILVKNGSIKASFICKNRLTILEAIII